MTIRVVELSSGSTKLEIVLSKNHDTKMKLLNFENWVNRGIRSFQKVLKVDDFHLLRRKYLKVKSWLNLTAIVFC